MKKIVSFTILSYGFAWGIWGIFYLTGDGLNPLALGLGMFAPSLVYLILKLVYKNSLHLGARFRLNFKASWRFYLLALIVPALMTVLAYLLYFTIFPSEFKFVPKLASLSQQTGIPMIVILGPGLIANFLFGPMVNALLAIGEEIGWRGFLFPQLREHFSALTSYILVGLIWSLWHLPLNLQGYNYGLGYAGQPWLGILAMFVSCFSLSIFLSYLVEKTGSLWSAALLHGAMNAWGRFYQLFQLNPHHMIFGPSMSGLLSGLPFLLLALIILLKKGGRYGTSRDL